MANDRTININIKYNIDTSDVNKARQASQAAQQATDQLRNAAQTAGKANPFKDMNASIETLRAKVLSLKDRITQASDPKEVKRLSDEYKSLKLQLDLATKSAFGFSKSLSSVSAATKTVTTNANESSNAFTSLVNIVKGFISLQIAQKAVTIGIEMTKLSGQVEGVSRAFQKIDENPVLTLDRLRAATHGAIPDLQLMQKALQATNLGVDIKKLPVLLEFAAARAQQTGESVDYLVDSIVTGIGRKSILRLDNLGLSATRLKEKFDGAALASQSVAKVTEGVAEIAKEELEKMGGYVDTGAEKVGRLTSSWENLRAALSKRIEQGGIIEFFTRVNQDLTKLVIGTQAYTDQLAKQRAALEVNAIIESDEYQLAKDNNEERIKILSLEVVKRVQSINARKEEIKLQQQALAAQATGYLGAGEREKIQKDIQQRKDFNKATEEGIAILRRYIIQLREPAKVDLSDTLQDLEDKVKDINEQILNTENISTKEGIKRATILTNEKNKTQDLIDKIKEQINWEQVLRDRRASGKVLPDKVVNLDKNKASDDFNKLVADFNKDVKPVKLPVTPYIPNDSWDKLELALKNRRNDIAEETNNIISDQIQSSFNAEIQRYDNQIARTKDFYDRQIELAGDNEKAKDKLRLDEDRKIKRLEQERNERQKKNALSAILINTALGIVKAFATSATIYDGIVEAALVAAEGASQYAIAERQPVAFAKGVIDLKGPGTGTSDSIPARLSRGESVMTAEETKKSMGILKAIRANKIDDRVFNKIDFSGGKQVFNDANIVRVLNKIESKKSPDFVKQGRTINEVYEENKTFKRFIRSKSF